jgi:hypothetical protein
MKKDTKKYDLKINVMCDDIILKFRTQEELSKNNKIEVKIEKALNLLKNIKVEERPIVSIVFSLNLKFQDKCFEKEEIFLSKKQYPKGVLALDLTRPEGQEIEIKNSNNGKITPVDGNDEQKGSGTTTETRTSTKLVATHRADLTGFTCSVNALRFSPNAECLATAGDDGSVFVWGCRRDRGYYRWDCVTDARHLSKRLMRGRCSEIYDIAWAPDSKRLMEPSTLPAIKRFESGDHAMS